MFNVYVRLTLWAAIWCGVGVAVSLTATALGLADASTVKAAIVAWVLFIGMAITVQRVRSKGGFGNSGEQEPK